MKNIVFHFSLTEREKIGSNIFSSLQHFLIHAHTLALKHPLTHSLSASNFRYLSLIAFLYFLPFHAQHYSILSRPTISV